MYKVNPRAERVNPNVFFPDRLAIRIKYNRAEIIWAQSKQN